MANKAAVPFLVTMMLVTGVCNTILNKYQMFTGEMGSWLVILMTWLYQRYLAPRLSNNSSPLLAGGYHPVNNTEGLDDEEDYTIRGPEASDDVTKPATLADGRVHLRGYKIFLLAAPACCDIAGTTLMNVGLLFVAASVYQMTRGALVLFVGLFSVLFLHRKLYLYHWLALFIVVLGVALVGLAGALFADNQGHDVTQGSAATVVTHAIREVQATTRSPEALKAVVDNLSGFNFFGLSVTRTVSATSRSTIDTCRTLFIWLVSLALGWETFKWLQVVGFALLVYGTFLFNDIVRPPLKACLPSSRRDREILLPEEPIEHM
ncbi:integral membrane protein [Aspergillus luchuensis]|uniref:Integral membrane protein n=1 Tax=Aspergillus kawachii TaxID=1069201 RepID=A0A146F7A5_ASPKA|nr:integral membrane protein [Aspergillus luchuensis]